MMKTIKQFTYIASAVVLFAAIACKNDNKASEALEQSTDVVNMVKTVKKTAKQSQDLKNIESVTEEELHNWFPAYLLGMKRKKISKGSLTGYGIIGASVVYRGEGKKKLVVAVNDGAGKKGMLLSSQYATVKHIKPKSTENRKQRILDNSTMLGTETYDKKENNTQIDFLYKNRFSVIIHGYDVSKENTWTAFKELNIDKLF